MFKKIKQIKIERKSIGIKEAWEKRNKILILRGIGGLGDILVHRMIFEDFKRIMPEAEIHFACPRPYHPAVENHPFVDQLLDSSKVDIRDYLVHYNTTTACGRYEMKMAPFSGKNRSDIWANHCGVLLTNRSMHINLSDEIKSYGFNRIQSSQKTVCLCPISSTESKNLTKDMIHGVIAKIKDMGFSVFILHSNPLGFEVDCPQIVGCNIQQWMGVIHAADYIISVDTASFHCAGGMGKPVCGVFTWADGKVYGQWYPKITLVQKRRTENGWNCPCYNWLMCPYEKSKTIKPCLSELTVDDIVGGFKELAKKY